MGSLFPHAIEVYECSDGTFRRSREAAEYHQGRIDNAKRATDMLDAGKSLGAALREVGFIPVDYLPALDEVFASTKLVISHWQCRDEPGYQPICVHSDGTVFVHGHAGSWSGPYGADCSVADIDFFWRRTKEQAERAEQRAKAKASP